MGLSDAKTAQGMATRHKQSVKAIVQGIGHINALLARMLKNNQIKWAGYGDGFDWYVRKLDETASWTNGQLGSRTFTEKDPIDKATLDYCFLDATYGIGEASIKSNRAAGDNKIYDIQKENARVAQSAMYRAIVGAIFSNSDGTVANGPAGLRTITCDCISTSSHCTSASTSMSYAGIPFFTSTGVASAFYSRTHASYPFDHKYWAPLVFEASDTPGLTSPEWSTMCFRILNWATNYMKRTADVTGTGKIIQPDLALMNTDPWNAMWARLIDKQVSYNTPISDKALTVAGFTNVKVGPLTLVYDENVPDDANTTPLERVFIVDSKSFVLETLNTKSEGLVEAEWKTDDPEIVGGIGVYKSNMGLRIDSPVSAACITGCDA